MSIERRQYQMKIVSEILKAKREGKNLIVELDAGLGKRIIAYLLTKILPRNERILIITPSQASLRDTVSTFISLYKEENANPNEIGYVTAGTPSWMKRRTLKEKRVVIATPISLANVLRKNPSLIENFSLIVINEIDKVVRRVAEKAEEEEDIHIETAKSLIKMPINRKRRIRLTYPWNELKKMFPQKACLVGMSGTLRDKHVIRDTGGYVEFKPEIETLIEALFPREKPLEIITMDALIRRTDAYRYIIRNLTIVRKIGVKDEKISSIVNIITDEIYKTGEKIAEKYKSLFKEKEIETVEKAITLIPETDPYKIKFLRLALVRRFVLASIPSHYKRFLMKRSIRRLLEEKTGRKLEELIPDKSSKIDKIIEISKEWSKLGKKITILTSFIIVANEIKKRLEEEGLRAFLITGRIREKGTVLEDFKKHQEPAILVMTPVGERDIDLADVELIIVHDIISTVKTMYQRFKRGRRCIVAVLYYQGTFEEKKVNKLLDRMKRSYPWSLQVE